MKRLQTIQSYANTIKNSFACNQLAIVCNKLPELNTQPEHKKYPNGQS